MRETLGEKQLCHLHWGLIPTWAKDPAIGFKTFNARAESADTKASFRQAFRLRRCLIPADGFYEWQRAAGTKLPWLIRRRDGRPLALAGLWEHWVPQTGPAIDSCSILTTSANTPMAAIHHRMPVILEAKHFAAWLDPQLQEVERLKPLLHPAAEGILELTPVADYVNRVGNEGPECQAPRQDPPQGSLFS